MQCVSKATGALGQRHDHVAHEEPFGNRDQILRLRQDLVLGIRMVRDPRILRPDKANRRVEHRKQLVRRLSAVAREIVSPVRSALGRTFPPKLEPSPNHTEPTNAHSAYGSRTLLKCFA